MRRDAPFLAGLALLSVALTWPLSLHLGDRFPHDAYDPGYCAWAMNWTVQSLVTEPASLADGNIFHPHRGTLFYADTIFGLALFGAPIILATGNPVLAHNILLLLSFVVAGWGMYLLALRLSGSRPAAFVAGAIFAFFPYNFAHIMHLELLFYGWIPFCVLFLHRHFDKPSWANALGAAAFFVLQVQVCAYYGVYLAYFAGLLGLYLLWRTFVRNRRMKVRGGPARFLAPLAGAAAAAAAVLGPYVLAYTRVHRRMLFERPLWEIEKYSAEVQRLLTPPEGNRIWGWFAGRPVGQEELLYPGIVPLALTVLWIVFAVRRARAERPDPGASKRGFRIWGFLNAGMALAVLALGVSGGFEIGAAGLSLSVRSLRNPVLILLLSLAARQIADVERRRAWAAFGRSLSPVERFYGLLVLISWLLTMGPVVRAFGREIVPGPYAALLRWLPGFDGLRVPSRFIVLTVFGLSIFSALGLADLLRRRPGRRASLPFVAGIVLVLIADVLAVPIPLVSAETAATLPAIYEEVRKLPADAVLIELPMPARDDEEYEDALPTFRSIFHGRRIVNGYSGYAPPAYRIVREAMERFPDRRSLDLLENLDVGYVLVRTEGYRADKGREIDGRVPDFARRLALVRREGSDALYRLVPYRRVHEHEAPVPPPPPRPVGDRSLWRAEASLNGRFASRAFDGDPATAWTTGYPQGEGDFFLLDLGRPERMSRMDLRLQSHPLDFPRRFVVEASLDGASWREIERDEGFFPDLASSMVEDFSRYAVPAIFGPVEARYVRIRLIGSHPARHWSIAEIELRGD